MDDSHELSKDFRLPEKIRTIEGKAVYCMGASAALYAFTKRMHERMHKRMSDGVVEVGMFAEELETIGDDLHELARQIEKINKQTI